MLLKQELVKNLDAELEGDYLYYKLDTGEKELNAISRVIFSDYQTYLVTIASAHNPDKNILFSARPVKRTLNLTEKLGLLPIPADGASSKISDAC